VADHPEHFERCFGTPHGMTFEAAANQFGLTYVHPDTQQEFVATYRAAAAGKGSTLIEVWTRRDENLAVHRALQAAVVDALEPAR
jgi:2-succinyl-5-enolpyruvyl-6-hydroxy-3-cyclohexene-1-carboxylate synthase